MQGVGKPELIVDGAASPHTYTMKPSNASALQSAKVIFWVGPGLEAFLEKPLEALGTDASIAELDKAPGLTKLKFREGGAFEAHDDGDEHDAHDHAKQADGHDHAAEAGDHQDHADDDHDHDHGAFDTHLWLDPMNAKAMATEITTTLVAADPANALTYQANAKALDDKLDALDAEIAGIVSPVKDKPFIVFHDAYQYFEHRYKVRVAGSITVSPETIPVPSASRKSTRRSANSVPPASSPNRSSSRASSMSCSRAPRQRPACSIRKRQHWMPALISTSR
jgi:zinc transport system substrate-binding protein